MEALPLSAKHYSPYPILSAHTNPPPKNIAGSDVHHEATSFILQIHSIGR